MHVVQERIIIPPEIYEKILSGEYIRVGTVVKQAGKTLNPIKHFLKTEPITKVKSSKMKYVIIGVGAIATIGASAYAAHKHSKKTKLKRIQDTHNTVVIDYLESTQKASVTLEQIKNLIDSFYLIEKQMTSEEVKIELSEEELKLFYSVVKRYTESLANLNQYPINEVNLIQDRSIESTIEYLNIQKEIFKIIHLRKTNI